MHSVKDIERTMSILRYKLFGKALRSKDKAKSLRRCIAESAKVQEDVAKIDLYNLSLKETHLRQKTIEMTEAARLLYQGDMNESNMYRLQEIFNELECLKQERNSLSKTKSALFDIRSTKDKEMASLILEKHVLDEHYKQKIKKYTRPSARSLSTKANRLQMSRELEKDTREEISSILKSDDEESCDAEQNHDKFTDWLDTLKSKVHVDHKQKDKQSDLRERLEKMKNR